MNRHTFFDTKVGEYIRLSSPYLKTKNLNRIGLFTPNKLYKILEIDRNDGTFTVINDKNEKYLVSYFGCQKRELPQQRAIVKMHNFLKKK